MTYLLTCDNDNVVLDAAKGLAEMCDYGETVRRPV